MILVIALVGFLTWLILLIPMPQVFRQIIIAILCAGVIVWILQSFGISTGLPRIRLK